MNPKTHLYQGAIKQKDITWYRCSDCGLTYFNPCKESTMRPNNKFCDINCMIYVLENGLQQCNKRPRGYKQWIKDQQNTIGK